MEESSEEGGRGLVGAAQCEFTFRGLFSRIIQAAHRLFVYRPFSPFCPFSRGGAGRILCLRRFLQEEAESRGRR